MVFGVAACPNVTKSLVATCAMGSQRRGDGFFFIVATGCIRKSLLSLPENRFASLTIFAEGIVGTVVWGRCTEWWNDGGRGGIVSGNCNVTALVIATCL